MVNKTIVFLLLFVILMPVAVSNPSNHDAMCKTKAYLARSVVESLNDGLELEFINFFFPNVQSAEELQTAMNWGEQIKQEAFAMYKEDQDPVSVAEKMYHLCKEKINEQTVSTDIGADKNKPRYPLTGLCLVG